MIQKPQTIYERPDERDALRARVAELEAALSTWKADHAATKGELFRVLPEHLRYREALEKIDLTLNQPGQPSWEFEDSIQRIAHAALYPEPKP